MKQPKNEKAYLIANTALTDIADLITSEKSITRAEIESILKKYVKDIKELFNENGTHIN